jgi:hypothetical protein
MYKKLLFVIVLVIALAACKKDDTFTNYNFKDQVLSGKIANSPWTMGSGYGHIWVSNNDTSIIITIFDSYFDDPCNIETGSDEIFFAVPKKVGLYSVVYNPQDPQLDHSVIFRVWDGDSNYYASDGAIEIVMVNDTIISGRMDARCDESNFVNGNFKVKICD